MKNISSFILATVAILSITLPGAASADPRTDATAFCARADKKMPAAGKQFDGKPADEMVMTLTQGVHLLQGDGSVEIFEDDSFLMTRPKNVATFYGLSRYSGGEIQMRGNTVAGCSKEQLSELMRRNKILLPGMTASASGSIQ